MTNRPSITINIIWMASAGLVLITAGFLKFHYLLTEPTLGQGFWESWEFFLILIPLEIGLGIWLLSGLFRKAAWLVAVISFGIFMAFTLQKGLAGAEFCDCFGQIHSNPWITLLTIDIPLFLGLLMFRPVGQKLLPPPWPSAKHFFSIAIPTFILLGTLVLILILNKPPEKTAKYEAVKPVEKTRKESTKKDSIKQINAEPISDQIR